MSSTDDSPRPTKGTGLDASFENLTLYMARELMNGLKELRVKLDRTLDDPWFHGNVDKDRCRISIRYHTDDLIGMALTNAANLEKRICELVDH